MDNAQPPAKGDTFLWDTELRGFGLRVTAGGAKSYVLQYRVTGRTARRLTIGGHGSPWTVELARKEAGRKLIQVRQGIDPVDEAKRLTDEADKQRRAQEALAFDSYADQFVELYLKSSWPDTWRSAQGVLKAVKPAFAGKSLSQISRADVAAVLDTYFDRPGAKKMTHSVLRKLFNWSADRGDLPHSPMSSMKAPKTVAPRRRVLAPEELVAVWSATAGMGPIWRPLVRLLILTLQRRDEVASLDWSEIDLDRGVWNLPAERAKNDQAHRIPLSDLALAELQALGPRSKGLVFTTTGETAVSGFSKAKKKLDGDVLKVLQKHAEEEGQDVATVALKPWRFHDLRRTGATNLQALGIPVEVTEAVLNHVSGTTGGIAGVYNLYRYEPEKRQALAKWSDHLSQLCSCEVP